MKIEIHPEIVQKHNVSGPRYTSYPPVPNFSSDVGEKEYIEYLSSHKVTPKISLYFHIPFCKSLCYYCGCNVVITQNQEIIERYLKYLKKEVELVLSYLKSDHVVHQLHWGGGTPNFLSLNQIEDLFLFIKEHFVIDPHAEISIELDPRTTKKEQLQLLKNLGFNRISFGVQDINDEVQVSVHRIQPVELIEELYYSARDLGFDSINMDFIYGLPYQTKSSYENNLIKILEWKPDRLAFFSYAHVPWIKKHQKLIPLEKLPSPLEKIQIFKNIVETLTENGYIYIGLDHFAKPEDELSKAFLQKKLHRNFQGYTVLDSMDVIAFGITAIGQFQNLYIRNKKGLEEYRKTLDLNKLPIHDGYQMNFDDILRRDVILKIMCNLYVDFSEIEETYRIKFYEYFHNSIQKLKPLIEDGLIEIENHQLKILPNGRPLIRNVAMAFDAFLENKKDQKPIYSKTI
ncbi:MAG: oxygen-independent coproporphyrinogen III oxidase [Leptospiraceae bacterium]|nr:oxygen-independent coproporphyrinogen III oxidase [Leptospiraceae bacterium]MDW7975316.1 oxygen-independent coproporphyrinogen III oxidase [Leptospiraceae bacterium]